MNPVRQMLILKNCAGNWPGYSVCSILTCPHSQRTRALRYRSQAYIRNWRSACAAFSCTATKQKDPGSKLLLPDTGSEQLAGNGGPEDRIEEHAGVNLVAAGAP